MNTTPTNVKLQSATVETVVLVYRTMNSTEALNWLKERKKKSIGLLDFLEERANYK